MSAGNDWLRSLLRPTPDDEAEPEETPVDYEGGTRKPTPPPPPSMNAAIRRARFGNVAGIDEPPDAA